MCYIDIEITHDMLAAAIEFMPNVRGTRDITTDRSAQLFLISEFAFAEWFLGDWRRHPFRETNCETNFMDSTEMRSSAARYFSNRLKLLVKQPYVNIRNANYYVNAIIVTHETHVPALQAGWTCRICGWETDAEVRAAPVDYFPVGDGHPARFRCHYIPISDLQPMSTFPIPRMV